MTFEESLKKLLEIYPRHVSSWGRTDADKWFVFQVSALAKKTALGCIPENEGDHGYCPSRRQGLRCNIETANEQNDVIRSRIEQEFSQEKGTK